MPGDTYTLKDEPQPQVLLVFGLSNLKPAASSVSTYSTVQPFRYMSDVASTKTFRPSKLKTLSIMPDWFSNDMEYWKPEHPPPTTPMRNPAGSGSWVAMISRTFSTALPVSVIGAFFTSVVSGVTVVVAMRFSLSVAAALSLRHFHRWHQ